MKCCNDYVPRHSEILSIADQLELSRAHERSRYLSISIDTEEYLGALCMGIKQRTFRLSSVFFQ